MASLAGLAAQATAEMSQQRGGSVWSRLEARPDPQLDSLVRDLRADDALVVVGTIDGAVGRLRGDPPGGSARRLDGGAGRDIYVLPDARGVESARP